LQAVEAVLYFSVFEAVRVNYHWLDFDVEFVHYYSLDKWVFPLIMSIRSLESIMILFP
jgi:hypothetical protein